MASFDFHTYRGIQRMSRRLLVFLLLSLFARPVLAQVEPRPEPTQNPAATFRLFATTNIYTFIKLDTRDGRIWQVQWGDNDHRFTDLLSPKALVAGGQPGRFTLYPTNNIFTFILLDQDTGDEWQVQWGKPEERGMVSIP